jgi:hypothetical protein
MLDAMSRIFDMSSSGVSFPDGYDDDGDDWMLASSGAGWAAA